MGNAIALALRMSAAPFVLGSRWVTNLQTRHEGVPSPRWSVGLVSKVLLDEFFFVTELIFAELLSIPDRRLVAREILKSLDLFEERGWIEKPENYHPAPPAVEKFTLQNVGVLWGSYRHLSFESGYQPHAGEPGRKRWLEHEGNRTAHAWVLEHCGEPRPWLLCVPGYRMGHPVVDFTAFGARWLHHTLGINVAIPVLPFHGPRREGKRGGEGFFSTNVIDTIHAQAQAVWDVRRTLGWIVARGAPSVGMYGVSLGGYTAALVSGLEDDLDCVITGIPGADFLRLMQAQVPRVLRDVAGRLGFSLGRIEKLLRVISPLALPSRLPRERRYLFAGIADRVLSPDHARDLWEHWDRPRIAWYQGGHVSFLWEKEVKALISDALEESGLTALGYARTNVKRAAG